MADERGYLPMHVPILKRIGAQSGDEVCATRGGVFIEGTLVARALKDDSRGRPLPRWNACRKLKGQELFLLSSYSPFSFEQSLFRTGEARRCDRAGHPLVDLVMRMSTQRAAVIGLLVMSTIAAADRPVYCGTERWKTFIAEAAVQSDIPQQWLNAVIRGESAGCESIDGHPITSKVGAMGLMQLMPGTWNDVRRRLGLGDDPYNPRDNILAGAAYLRDLYDRYGSPGFLAAYHAGPERYEAYRLGERSLPRRRSNICIVCVQNCA